MSVARALRPAVRTAAAIAALACVYPAAGMEKDEHRAAQEAIAAQYQTERQKCAVRHGNAADLCIARAHGVRDVAKAELDAAYKPSPRANQKAALARAKAALGIAREECDDAKSGAREACRKDAQAAYDQAVAEASKYGQGKKNSIN